MIRLLSLLWIAVVALSGAYLGIRMADGVTFNTDLLALMPRDAQDIELQRATDAATDALSRRVLLLIGHHDRASARTAAQHVARYLSAGELLSVETTELASDRVQAMGALYFRHRHNLLSPEDRASLQAGREDQIASRALAQIFGPLGMADGRLLQNDPFLLLPAFIGSLPLPASRLAVDEGLLSVRDGDTTWVLIAGQLSGGPYELETQRRLVDTLTTAVAEQRATLPELQVLTVGAVFYAKAGAEQALRESSIIGGLSLAATILLVLVVFRALRPLWLSLLAIAVGVTTALAACFWLFGELHVAVLLFGISLIGIAVDYSLQYLTEWFAPNLVPPRARLTRVLPGMTVGMASVLVGYSTLFFAPFPGLHEIAAFSAIGLLASWITVVLWLPALDRAAPTQRHGPRLLSATALVWRFWEAEETKRVRFGVMGVVLALAVIGCFRLSTDDDIRNMQSLSPTLASEQARVHDIIGGGTDTRIFLVMGRNDEEALQRQEALIERLGGLVASRALGAFQAAAQFVPSAARQHDNRELRRSRLDGDLLDRHAQRIGLDPEAARAGADDVLTFRDAAGVDGPMRFLSWLRLGESDATAMHIVLLAGIADSMAVAAAASGLPGVHFVDPAASFSDLLAAYRGRAVVLLAVSLLLMMPILLWRYGMRRGARVLMAPLLVLVLTPPLRALGGDAFTFFDAMALILVLSVTVDYAVFVAEATPARVSITLLATALAALTTLLSFGMLAWSEARAVHAFGATMLIGVCLAVLLVPLSAVGRPSPRRLS